MATRPARANEPIPIRSAKSGATNAAQFARRPGAGVWAFLALETAIAATLLVTQVPKLEGALLVFALLLALDVVADTKPVRLYGDSYITISFVVVAAIIVLFGVPGVVLAGLAEGLTGTTRRIVRRRADLWDPHNAAMFPIVYAAGALVYTQLAGIHPEGFELALIPVILATTMTTFSLNAVLIGAFGRIYLGEPFSDFWSKHSWLLPHYLAFGLTGLALALAYVGLGVAGILIFAMPALMFHIAMNQYVEKTKDNVQKLKEQNTRLQLANVEIARVSDELRESYDGTLEALVNALDARDQETKGHSIRVSKYMMDIAREMGVREGSKDWIDMQRGSLLHDVGKIGVSDTILLKPGKLTDDEWASMRQHPEIGYNMLRQVKFLEGAAEIILAHHERWDGKGYPRGLGGDDVPLGARIFTVVDTFDSMTSDRPYRQALSTQEALNEILRCSNSQFDPRVVEAFLDIYDTWVKARRDLHAEPKLRRAA